jgi:ATP-binding protein involved in chromosome partitioning
VSSHADLGALRRRWLRDAVANGARSSSNGQRVVESEAIGEALRRVQAPSCLGGWRYARRVEINRDEVLKALEQVIDPELRRPVTELDMVRDLEVHDGVVALTIVLTVAGCPLRDSFEQQVEQALAGVPGVTGVELSFTVMTPEERQALTQKLRGGAPEREGVIRLPQNCRVLAVASGKGGVGKSSLAANLAVALSEAGHSVGVLDADIYGHSIPHILGIRQRPIAVDDLIVPPVKDDLKLMSIGFFLETSNEPVMWRGPMLHRALEQFLTDVHWGEIDVLVVDMPPGTGDVSISLGQLLPRAEVVVVTTPQKLAQDVAARAAAMAQKTNMRLLGVVENMSGDVFGSGGGEELADELGVPLLGTVPLDPALREQGDAGAPVVSAQPEAESAHAILAIAQEIEALRREPAGPGIVKSLPLVG